MGNQSHVKLYSMLLAFLEGHGCSLIEHGSAERGLNIADARAFIGLLRTNQVRLLGVELWRATSDRLELDVAEIWYPSTSDEVACYKDAEHYFNRVTTGLGDVFTIQFN